MLPQERSENIKRAIFSYLETNWTITAKEFQGESALDTTAITEWAWFGIVGEAGRHFVRHADGHNLGDLVNYLLECVVNVKPTDTITRINALRDTAVSLLRRASIAVTDTAGGTGAAIGNVVSQGVMAVQPLGIENDVDKMSIIFPFRYLEQYAP